jgi:ABC-type Mn2+/Zn2+ transport system ATPase subunit
MGRYPQLGWWKPFRACDDEVVEKALATMGLRDLRGRQIRALSGGQQQRVFLARALAQEAHVLLLDEPFTGLDRPSRQALAGQLRQLALEGRLVMASHHDLASVKDIFDEVFFIRRQPVAFGDVDATFTPANIEATFGPGGKEVA